MCCFCIFRKNIHFFLILKEEIQETIEKFLHAILQLCFAMKIRLLLRVPYLKEKKMIKTENATYLKTNTISYSTYQDRANSHLKRRMKTSTHFFCFLMIISPFIVLSYRPCWRNCDGLYTQCGHAAPNTFQAFFTCSSSLHECRNNCRREIDDQFNFFEWNDEKGKEKTRNIRTKPLDAATHF